MTVKVISGESIGIKSKVRTRTTTYYLDFTLDPATNIENQPFVQSLPSGWESFAYILEGTVTFGYHAVPVHSIAVFSTEEGEVENTKKQPAHFVLVSGEPIKEPVFQHGPCSMNSEDEIRQAMQDYRNCQNGFEPAKTWKSE